MTLPIRLALAADAPALCAIYAPMVAGTAVSFELEPPSVEEMRRRIEANLLLLPWLVCERGGIIGFAYAGVFRLRAAYQWTVEVTVYVHPDHRRTGVARALYASLFRCLRVQGYRTALAVIALPNPASVALHEGMGFRLVGVFHQVGYKMDEWHDVGWWELPLRNLPKPPPPPRPLPEVVNSAAWRAALETS